MGSSRTPMMSLSFMIRSSTSSILTSVPDHLPNSTRSPTLRSIGMSFPASSRPPGPIAVTSPCDGFSWAVSGMIMPPADFASASMRLTTTRSCSGRNFIGISLGSDEPFDFSRALTGRRASSQRIFVAFVQAANSVAVEYLLIDFQAGVWKKFRWELFDCETDSIRGTRESSVANRVSWPAPSAPRRSQLYLAPGGKQFRLDAVVKRGHAASVTGRIEFVLLVRCRLRPPQRAISDFINRTASDLATLQQGVDVALSLSLLDAVLGHDLGHEVVLALERRQILLGELAPLRPDFLEHDLPGFGGSLGFRSGCIHIRSYVGHVSTSKIETNILLNGHHSRDKTHIRSKRAKTTPCLTNIFIVVTNSIVFLSTTGDL